MNHLVRSINSLVAAALVVLLSLGVPAAVSAQELTPEHIALARKYVDLTDTSQIYETALIKTGIDSMRTIVALNPEITDQVSDAIGVVIQQYADKKGELFDQFARIYATRFSMDELAEIVKFYESPVGAKLAKTNAEINNELAAVMQLFQANLNTEFFAKVKAELRTKGIDL